MAQTITQWEYMTVDLPVVPYLSKTDPANAEPRTALDVLNDWGSLGWEAIQIVDRTALLKRRVRSVQAPLPFPVPGPRTGVAMQRARTANSAL